MKEVLCMISSPPESANAKRGLALAAEWMKQGRSVKICLIQDGVYASLARSKMSGGLESAQWFSLADDLQIRGFKAEDLSQGVRILDYAQLVQMMLSDEQQVLGAF